MIRPVRWLVWRAYGGHRRGRNAPLGGHCAETGDTRGRSKTDFILVIIKRRYDFGDQRAVPSFNEALGVLNLERWT